MPIKLIVFDMAGTTVKDNDNVSEAFQSALKKYSYNIPIKDINPIMGYEKNDAIRQMLEKYETDPSKISDFLVTAIHHEFVQKMIDHYQNAEGIEALPNVETTLADLRQQGIKVGVNTGFSKDIAETIINRLKWREKGLIDYVVGSDEVELGRPHPFMIQKMMRESGVSDSRQVAKVGDTEVDIREGKNIGCRYVIGITTGAFTREELNKYGPTHIIDDISEVLSIIN